MAKQALYKKDMFGASLQIKKLMGEIVGKHSLELKFCEMYTSIIKTLPLLQSALSDEQVFRLFAPLQLKNAVTELFQQLEMQVRLARQQTAGEEEEQKEDFMKMVHQDWQASKIISEKLQEIFFEDARFNKMLLSYLTESLDYAKVVRPYLKNIKSLKIIQQEHLELAFIQIESKGRYQKRIAEFMAIDIDMDLQNLQADIEK